MSVGTLYEYLPNKQARLVALAECHVATAEQGIDRILASAEPTPAWLAALQRAIVASHRYPSQALALATGDAAVELRTRAQSLRERVLAALIARARAAGASDSDLRARTAFGLVAELSSATGYELVTEAEHAPMLRHLLELAMAAVPEKHATAASSFKT